MQEAKRLLINVVVWNHRQALGRLLASLEYQTVDDFQTIVVDNASTDGVAAWLNQTYPKAAVVLRNFKNQGLARAYNQAAAWALAHWDDAALDGRFVMFVEPDEVFTSSAIGQLLQVLDADPAIMLAGPKLMVGRRLLGDSDDSSEIAPTETIESVATVLTKTRRFYDLGRGQDDQGQYDRQAEVFAPNRACFVVRASALKQLALNGEWFDEMLPVGQIVWDVFWRARVLGFKAALVPEARVCRMPRPKSQDRQADRLARQLRRHLRTKNDFFINRLVHLPWTLVDWVRTAGACVLSPRLLAFWFVSWKDWPALRRKRKALMGRPHRSAAELRRWFL
jgi:GT2 family glycosyltransferase